MVDFIICFITTVYQDAFNIFDKDCDGRISNDKLTAIMKTVGDDVTDQELQDMINAVDADGKNECAKHNKSCRLTA